MITELQDGIYDGGTLPRLSWDEYRAVPRLNPSALDWAVTHTMAHVRAAIDGKLGEDSKALTFGSAYHMQLLEPELFAERYALAGQCEALTKAGEQCSYGGKIRSAGQWFCARHGEGRGADDIECLPPDDAATIKAMRAKVVAHPVVKLFRMNGGCEVSILWTDQRSGIKLKSRIDKWIPDCKWSDNTAHPVMLDLKSVTSADRRSVAAAMESYGWARAAAMRMDAIETLTGKGTDNYYLVCQEKDSFEVKVWPIGTDTLAGARWEYRGLLLRWADCVKKNEYPGYPVTLDDELECPDWKLGYYQANAIQETRHDHAGRTGPSAAERIIDAPARSIEAVTYDPSDTIPY